ncbi:MAG TPA: CvpA family protein [Thermodesulfobacteriota bacterium]
MSALDVVILAGLAFFLVRGLLNGVVGELAPLVGLAAGVAASATLTPQAVVLAERQWSWVAGLAPGVRLWLAGAVVFVVAYAICRLAASFLAGRGEPGRAPGGLARLAGAALGLAKGAVLFGFALLGLSWLLAGPTANSLLERSVMARELTRLSASLLGWAHAWL